MHRITDEKVDKFLQKHLNSHTGLLQELEEYALQNNVPIVQPEVARLLSILVKMQKPKRILEVGCAIGYSALLMLEAAPDACLTTIERDAAMKESAEANFAKAGVQEKVHIIEGDACEIVPRLTAQNCEAEKYDLIFLDAAKSRYGDFLPYCVQLLKKGGLLIGDNVLFRGMVARDYDEVPHAIRTIYYRLNEFHDALQKTDELESSILPMGDGVSISIRK